jgi:hypothetical protein
MSQCNYCTLQGIENRARQQGKKVVVRSSDKGGVYVHVMNNAEELDTKPWDNGNKQIVSWFMELGEYCEC